MGSLTVPETPVALRLEGILGRFPGGDSLRDKSIDLCGGFLGYHVRSAVILVGIESGAAVVFADGPNAHRAARDYRRVSLVLDGSPVTIHLAPGGGWVLPTL